MVLSQEIFQNDQRDASFVQIITSTSDRESWVKEDRQVMTSDVREQALTLEWKESYYHALQAYYIARNCSRGKGDISMMREKFFSLDSKLADMERRFGVAVRWASTDKDYVDTKRLVMSNRRDQIHTCLWASVVKRHYLLQMKAKYADGQKIAKKLCTNIGKETKRCKSLQACRLQKCLHV